MILSCKKICQYILRIRCVLILVNNYVLKLMLILFQNIVILLKKSDGVKNHIIKIHCVASQKLRLIFTVALGNFRLSEISRVFSLVSPVINKRVLCPAYLTQNRLMIKILVLDAEALLYPFHNSLLVVGVINRKVL